MKVVLPLLLCPFLVGGCAYIHLEKTVGTNTVFSASSVRWLWQTEGFRVSLQVEGNRLDAELGKTQTDTASVQAAVEGAVEGVVRAIKTP